MGVTMPCRQGVNLGLRESIINALYFLNFVFYSYNG